MDIKKNRVFPRVAAIHDLSGFGRSSLTVVLPTLSKMGIQVCPLPTALLSTQTSGFDNYYFLDLTESMKEIISHWTALGIQFSSVYTGFLGSSEQINLVSEFIENCRKSTSKEKILTLIDPVLGDDGEPYGPVDDKMIEGMRDLVRKADIITPNCTEAALLLNKPVKQRYSREEIKEYLIALAEMGPQKIVITSIPIQGRECFNSTYFYDKDVSTFWKVECENLPVSYPGTGDMFASIIVGSLLKEVSFPEAVDRAVQVVFKALQETCQLNIPEREGVLIETVLDALVDPLDISTYKVVN